MPTAPPPAPQPLNPFPMCQSFPPSYGAINEVTIAQPATSTIVQPIASQLIVIGGCPICRIGVLEDDYSCLGILCAIAFFPLGILCCLATKNRRCTNCHAIL
jgi:hypothetical protein